MMISPKTIWKDPVMSKVIAVGLIWLLGSIILKITNLFVGVDTWFKDNLNFSYFKISIAFLIVILILFLLLFWIRKDKLKKKEQLSNFNGEKISISKLKIDFSNVERIGIVGNTGVGKTTLIENLCRIRNQHQITQGTGAYILNFSLKEEKFGALLDGSGQSQSEQNDIAIESHILIIMLDHNYSESTIKVNNDRIEEHKKFLLLLKDRLQTSNHEPKMIHFLFNKKDLWSNLPKSKLKNLKNTFISLINDFKKSFKDCEVTSSFHSNNITNNRTEFMLFISKKLS